MKWDERQAVYWSHVAPVYDDLYRSSWSRRENEWVSARLSFVSGTAPSPRILDLGCGTGLGALLLRPWTSLSGYVGLDVSQQMLNEATRLYGVKTQLGAMDELSFASDGEFDFVICLFSAASFASDPARLFSEIERVLRSGGRAYVSTLGRRLRSSSVPRRYRTRGLQAYAPSAEAHRFRPRELRQLAEAVGLEVVSVTGMNALANTFEHTLFWSAGRAIAHTAPVLSHLLEIEVRKKKKEK